MLLWIPLLPFAGFVINTVGARMLPKRAVAVVASFVMFAAFAVELAWALTRSRTVAMTMPGDRATFSVSQIGQRLFQQYAFAFEATSILILVAMVGAITLAGRHLDKR